MKPFLVKPTTTCQARLDDVPAALFAEGAPIRDDIQWMPPGKRTITPFVDGEAKSVEITVNEAVAAKVAGQVEQMRKAAASGQGDYPYIDFNHQDNEASAEVLSTYWGGNDPVTGGIRAKVKWTDAGEAALKGKSYRRFSPSWLADTQTGEVVGVNENMGGLVNRAAFRTIQPVIAKRGGQTNDTEMTTEELNAAIAAGLKPVTDRLTALEAKATATTDPTATAALNAMEARLKVVETQAGKATLTQAKAAVALHARRGAIPPQNADVIAHFEAAYQANPDGTEKVLAAMPDNPVLGASFTAGSAGQQTTTPATDTAEGFVVTYRAKAAIAGTTKTAAMTAAIGANIKGYEAWRKADGKPAL